MMVLKDILSHPPLLNRAIPVCDGVWSQAAFYDQENNRPFEGYGFRGADPPFIFWIASALLP
jgi:hypothetical protein